MAQTESRTTRARSKDVDSAPTSPTKRNTRTRRNRSASMEQNAMDYQQNIPFNVDAMPTVPEEPDGLAQLQLAAAGDLPNHTAPPFPDFQGATTEAIKNVRRRGPRAQAKKGRGQQAAAPAASAPTAVMTNDDGDYHQQLARHAQHASQQMPPLDPALANVGATERKRLIDPQSGAQQFTFDSQEPQYQPAIPTQQDAGELVVTQDGAFQTDGRNIASTPHQRRGAPSHRTSPSRQSYQEQNSPQDGRAVTPQGTPPASDYATVQQQAKLFTAGLRRDKVPQKRKAWTSDECDALIHGIGRYHNAYATLKADDLKHRADLRDRSAEDLRHKARNMKFDYLKAGVTLPPGFESVLLDKKFQDKLTAMGREYVQAQMRQPKSKKQKTTDIPSPSQEVDESSQNVD